MDLRLILESLLMASETPLPASELARLVRKRASTFTDEQVYPKAEESIDRQEAEQALDMEALAATTEEEVASTLLELNEFYEQHQRSFFISKRSQGWKIFTRPAYAGFVQHLFPDRKPERLTGPALETLAITAYRQPVTKSALEAIRGVSCDGMLQKLLDRELIRIDGRADLPGRPLLYATTDLFLEHFGVPDLDELPNLLELQAIKLPDGTEANEAEEGPHSPADSDDSVPSPDPPSKLDLSLPTAP